MSLLSSSTGLIFFSNLPTATWPHGLTIALVIFFGINAIGRGFFHRGWPSDRASIQAEMRRSVVSKVAEPVPVESAFTAADQIIIPKGL
jgi:hypothetical protein